ncbi:MAG: Preprotein translocase subunit SecG [Candidatus Alkanophagales archaeon MCA70_species_2]|nr:Preprotein translocase subunit SecG [Candidatus Alkanophaga liquidiphilum]
MATKKAVKGKSKKARRGRGGSERSGLVSSAGLMRYFDVEESAIKISPKAIVLIGILIGVVVLALEIYYGVWPP